METKEKEEEDITPMIKKEIDNILDIYNQILLKFKLNEKFNINEKNKYVELIIQQKR